MIFGGTVIIWLMVLEVVFKFFTKRKDLDELNIKAQLLLIGIIVILFCDILLLSGVRSVYVALLVVAFIGFGILRRRVAR